MSRGDSKKDGGPTDERGVSAGTSSDHRAGRGTARRLPQEAEGPSPQALAPSPSLDGELDPASPATSAGLDHVPTRPLRRLDLSELGEMDGPTGVEADLDAASVSSVAPGPLAGYGQTSMGVSESASPEDWQDPPELPEPPVSFVPPEMTLPPRLPEEIESESELDVDVSAHLTGEAVLATSGQDGAPSALGLHTPALPEITPSSDPLALKLRQGRITEDLQGTTRRGSGGGRDSEFGPAIISKVVDMHPSVMQMTPLADGGPGVTDSGWTGSETESETVARDADFVTAVWSAQDLAGHLERPPEPSPSEPKGSSGSPAVPEETSVIGGRYRVLERIGVGGMARIFRVQHLELGKHFALKIIHTALSEDTKVREMFYREARLASSLDHPNIVLLTDFGVDEGFGAFIVMEYLKGETLHARLRREGRLHPNVACEVALQVGEALMFIHGRDVVHCDIKSENVFLCNPPAEARRRTIVKLLDFGLSRQEIGSGRVSVSEVGGTPAYMAPERINRLSPRASMDIYSLGVLFYEMLSGTLPFSGTVEDVLLAQLNTEPEPLSARLGDPLDDRLEELVMKALRKDPARRQRDMGAFVYELRTVMDMLGIGRRRGRQPAERLRGTGTAARVKGCELLVADCPLPLFVVDPRGTITLANKAFASFINMEMERVAGTPLVETRLGRVCPEILEDIQRTVAERAQTQRILSFPWRTAKQVSMMVWLTPQVVDSRLAAVLGVIHPFSTSERH